MSERFRIISPLGAGGFGDAFRAWDTTTGVPVVLKRPLARHIGNRSVLERFDREIRRLLDLVHPHIVPIVDHGHDADGLPFLAMRFLPGGSLEDRPRPSPVAHLRRWLPGVAAALDYVHARGFLHRDVKPANIFFDTRTVPFLGDFGIAKIIDEELAEQEEDTLTKTGGAIGTHPYMAPEFFRKPRVLSGAYDQYALAVTVFEMVAGKRPFTGDAGQLVLAHAIEKPPSLTTLAQDVPGSLAAAVSRALAKDPAKRFPSCLAFAEAALTDLPPMRAGGDLHQFLCPGCRRLVRVPADFHGRSCKCPYCEEKLRVAANLDALWRHDEAPTTTRSTGSTGPAEPPGGTSNDSAWSGESRSGRRLPDSVFILGLPISASVILCAIVLAMLMPSLFRDAVALFLGPFREVVEVPPTPVPVVAGTAEGQPREPPPQPPSLSTAESPARPAAVEVPPTPVPVVVRTAEEQPQSPPQPPSPTSPESPVLPATLKNSIGIELTLILAGEFSMGSADVDTDEKPVHEVRLTKPFYLGVYEVTNGQWKAVMGGKPPSEWKEDDRPVETVSWDDAMLFCQKLSVLPEERQAGREYRLPTEAEWEYACRAGTNTRYSFGDDESLLGDYAWYDSNSSSQTHPVGQKKPNAWGLYDMHGNVWEWCSCRYRSGAVTDPQVSSRVPGWVYRGGSWFINAGLCRSAFRYFSRPSDRNPYLGFRLALSPSGAQVVSPEAANAVTATPPPSPPVPELLPASPAPAVAPFDAAQARKHQEDWAKHLGIEVEVTNSIGQKFVVIPPGKFTMGEGQSAVDVTLTKPFLFGLTEVTNTQWKQLMGSVPSNWKNANLAVETVSWDDAVAFCRRLSALPEERQAGREYRLPTEAEWEYACRAGTNTGYSFGDDDSLLGEHAWFTDNSWEKTHPVGKKKPNAWGLFDMHGNVWEWCSDWYGDYGSGELTDPQGPSRGSVRIGALTQPNEPSRVFRGGSWRNTAGFCRSADRDWDAPVIRYSYLGFRLALSPSGAQLASPEAAGPAAATPSPTLPVPALSPAPPSPAVAPFYAAQARKHREDWAKHLGIEVEVTNSIGQKFVVIPPGKFTMGEGQSAVDVTLTKPFLLGQTAVTNAQWKAVMGGELPSRWKDDDRPVETVSWDDAMAFCRKLSAIAEERNAGRLYRLPTEAEWEYACRAGSTTGWSFGDSTERLGEYGWVNSNSTHPVGQKKPNAWRLFDMHGNVQEWCNDWYGEYPKSAVTNPQGPSEASAKVRRGGDWNNDYKDCRSANRNRILPSRRFNFLGFRLALSPAGAQLVSPEADK